MMKRALILGGAGTIGNHLCKRLKNEGYWVRVADIKYPEFSESMADDFLLADLRDKVNVDLAMRISSKESFDLVFALAAQMGGSLYVFSGESDYEIIYDSATMNLLIAKSAAEHEVKKILFSSSACCYSERRQMETDSPALVESSAWDGKPDSAYGIEKLFSEQVYDAFRRNKNLSIRICRFHNVFAEESTYYGGKEKYPSAVCRKVAEAKDGGSIEIYGDGKQTRSFIYVSEAIEGIMRLMESDYVYPVNIGSNELISINDLAKMVIDISGKKLTIKNISSNATGVRGRNSDNTLIKQVLGWSPTQPLKTGMEKLFWWINEQVAKT